MLPFCFHTRIASMKTENFKNNLYILNNLSSFLILIPCERKPWYKIIWLHIGGDSFTIVMTHCFPVNAEIALRLIFHIKIKWAATCSNGFSLLRMGWRARRAAGEENALWCQWFVYLILLQLILLYLSNGVHVVFFFLFTKSNVFSLRTCELYFLSHSQTQWDLSIVHICQ